ncbi:MAG: hypothetical protein COA74_07380 [Gammaproteobacteria bacterium]|nr:MAG: hypothetical protein COA74_07380 [Gammaproteobacteria bacterium]
MKNIKILRLLPSIFLASSLLVLSGCDSNNYSTDSPPPPPPVITTTDFSYEVLVTNLTSSQPFSPVTLVSHGDMPLWTIGSSASAGLELIAESGDNSEILDDEQILDGVTAGGILLPGMTEILTITTTAEDAPFLSVLTMLVNTNDAFSGKSVIDVSGLVIGDTMMMTAVSYDSGTEANSEAAGTMPGPADGGEGFNSARDDVGFVSMHPGVVSMDDGLRTSVLSAEHKFDNPVMKITITRLQ